MLNTCVGNKHKVIVVLPCNWPTGFIVLDLFYINDAYVLVKSILILFL